MTRRCPRAIRSRSLVSVSAGQRPGCAGAGSVGALGVAGDADLGRPAALTGIAALAADGEGRRPEDAGVVAVHGGHDLGLQVEQRQELLVVLGDAAADDEEVGREQELERRIVPLEALAPLLPREDLALLRRV